MEYRVRPTALCFGKHNIIIVTGYSAPKNDEIPSAPELDHDKAQTRDVVAFYAASSARSDKAQTACLGAVGCGRSSSSVWIRYESRGWT
jgi:hypothetical protein